MSINGYNIIKELGKGSAGVVYLATKGNSKDLLAIKKQDFTNYVTARMESNVLHRVSQKCDNVLGYLDSFMIGSDHHLVTEYVKGVSLFDIERNDNLTKEDPENILYLIVQLFNALSCLHSNNIVHRDVKNANIMINASSTYPLNLKDADLTLIDFGLACDDKNCGYNARSGTPAYMSPELIMNNKYNFEMYKASDVWAAGVCFYFLINKNPPIPARVEFISMKSNFDRMINYIKSGKPIEPLNFKDKRVTDIISACLDYNYKTRITAADVLQSEI